MRAITSICVLLLAGLFTSAGAKTIPAQKQTHTSKLSKLKSAHARSTKGKHSSTSKRARKTAKNWRKRGQQKIDGERTREIQESLIREHYLQGAPTGEWDQSTQTAMQRYQADNGWQSKMVPDSRALIKLGLGPDHEHLLNPESAMTSQPSVQTVPATAVPSTPANANQPQK